LSEIRDAIASALLLFKHPGRSHVSCTQSPTSPCSEATRALALTASDFELLSSRQPGNLFAKPNTLVDIVRPILPSSQTAVARQLPFAGAYLGTASNTCAESSMTIRFRAAEADELVDDERAAQRIYMGSAMTMENGEFY
jgi:hypothetical protein